MKNAFVGLLSLCCVACVSDPVVIAGFDAQPVAAELQQKGESRVLAGASVFDLERHFVWGASPLRGDDGKYYMVYSAFESEVCPFTTGWVVGSKLGLAVSDHPDRDYRSLGFFYNEDGYRPDTSAWDAQSVSNPHLRKFGDKYYLYYIGTRDPGNAQVKSKTDTLDRRNRLQQMLSIGVITFDSFDRLAKGDFRRGECILRPRTRVKPDNIVAPSPEGVEPLPDNIIVVNPSVVYRPDDRKYLLYFKGNIYDPHWRGIHGVAVGDTPTGPFVAQDFEVFTVETDGGRKLSAEDPYVWYNDEQKMFYAVFKDFTGDFTKSGPSLAWMQSLDGIKWTLPENSLFVPRAVTLLSGERVSLDRLERPQLLLDDEGNPSVLFAAAAVDDVNPKADGSSFNLQIPLKVRFEK